jgi:hypothetical protein
MCFRIIGHFTRMDRNLTLRRKTSARARPDQVSGKNLIAVQAASVISLYQPRAAHRATSAA